MNAFTDGSYFFDDIRNTNPWADTPLANYYLLSPRAKGTKSEQIVKEILVKKGYKVSPRTNPGHDLIVNGVKTEVKFGLATERNYNFETIFNHIGINKDWDEIIFACVNGDGEIRIVKYSKNNLPNCLLNHQQGGNTSDNDDFMIDGINAKSLLFDETAVVI